MGSNIVPHEADLRAWLRRTGVPRDEIDDTVQDAYVRIAQMASVDHIKNPRTYFFSAARSAMVSRIRRDRIVRIDILTGIEALALEDTTPGPDRQVSGRQELERVREMIEALPERCREVFKLRRIEGLPQRAIAARLGVTEHVVEQQAMRALKLLSAALTKSDAIVADQTNNKGQERDESRND